MINDSAISSKPNIVDIFNTIQFQAKHGDKSNTNLMSCCASPRRSVPDQKSSPTVEALLKVTLKIMYGLTIEWKPNVTRRHDKNKGKRNGLVGLLDDDDGSDTEDDDDQGEAQDQCGDGEKGG